MLSTPLPCLYPGNVLIIKSHYFIDNDSFVRPELAKAQSHKWFDHQISFRVLVHRKSGGTVGLNCWQLAARTAGLAGRWGM